MTDTIKLANDREFLWQWDVGQGLIVPDGVSEVHYGTPMMENFYVFKVDDTHYIPILDRVLQRRATELIVYEYLIDGQDGHTMRRTTFRIKSRKKPANYQATPDQAHSLEWWTEQAEEIIGDAVGVWLDEHPEATTTVQDGSLTESKFSDALKLKSIKDYVTPEMFGAKGDGETDDRNSIQNAIMYAIQNNLIVVLTTMYAIKKPILIPPLTKMVGLNRKTCGLIKIDNSTLSAEDIAEMDISLTYTWNGLKKNACIINCVLNTSPEEWGRYYTIKDLTLKTDVAFQNSYGAYFASHFADAIMECVDVIGFNTGIYNDPASPSFLSSFIDIYIDAIYDGFSVSCNLTRIDRVFVENTSHWGFNTGGNISVGWIGVSNAKGGICFRLFSATVDVISIEDCKNVEEYLRVSGVNNIGKLSWHPVNNDAPSDCLIENVSIGTRTIIDTIQFQATNSKSFVFIKNTGGSIRFNMSPNDFDSSLLTFSYNAETATETIMNGVSVNKPRLSMDGAKYVDGNNFLEYVNGKWRGGYSEAISAPSVSSSEAYYTLTMSPNSKICNLLGHFIYSGGNNKVVTFANLEKKPSRNFVILGRNARDGSAVFIGVLPDGLNVYGLNNSLQVGDRVEFDFTYA